MSTQYQTQQRQWVDITLTSSRHYDQPNNQLQLEGTFQTPSGKQLTLPAFWLGGDQWCLRYSHPETGHHTFTTLCSDEQNNGLHQQQGTINIAPYKGDNPLFKHGGITIASDQRHFAHEDGKPFFWLGDTWWMGLCNRLSDQAFNELAAQRAAMGFNVVQIVAGLFPDMPAFDARSKNNGGFAWSRHFNQLNPDFFNEADKRIQSLVEHGITPCILGSWGYYLEWMGVEKMQQHWRHLIARWGALPVVWVSSGEQTMPWYLTSPTARNKVSTNLKQDWSTVTNFIRNINAYNRPVTAHPVSSASDSVNDASLIDFEMQQTGHDQPTQQQATRALDGWINNPSKPVISAESRYEALDISPPVTTQNVREAFWSHTLNSGLAGHTYGANGIWQVNLPDKPFGQSPAGNDWGKLPWQDAMQLPAAKQICNSTAFIRSLPWTQAQPKQMHPSENTLAKCLKHLRPTRLRHYLQNTFANGCINTPVAAAESRNKQWALYYTVTKRPFTIDLPADINNVQAKWFDPSNGQLHDIELQSFVGEANIKLAPLHPNDAGDWDWVLYVSTLE